MGIHHLGRQVLVVWPWKSASTSLESVTEMCCRGAEARAVGLDGTNGIFCDHHFIPCAVGLGAEDITPVLGSYFADGPVESTMQTTLSVEPSHEP